MSDGLSGDLPGRHGEETLECGSCRRSGPRVCFSPQADVVGGLVICAIGVDAVCHIRRRREFLALAWIPLLLGAHQFIEALVWLWLQGHVPRGIGHVALWAYLLIAFVVLPVFVPLAVIALEPTRHRKLMMVPFALTGTVIAVILLAAMVRGPVGVRLAPYHLSYGIRVPDGFLIVALYVVGVSQRRDIRRRQPCCRDRHSPAHDLRVRFCVVRVGGRLQRSDRAALPLRRTRSRTRQDSAGGVISAG